MTSLIGSKLQLEGHRHMPPQLALVTGDTNSGPHACLAGYFTN